MPHTITNGFGLGIKCKVYISGSCRFCDKHFFDLKFYKGGYVCGECQCPCGYPHDECPKHADDPDAIIEL